MQVEVRESGGVTILALNGEIGIDAGKEQLSKAVWNALQNGALKILLNMGGVTRLYSAGTDELVSAHAMAANRGAKLRLSNLPAKLMEILTLTQLITVLDVYDTEEEALDAFRTV